MNNNCNFKGEHCLCSACEKMREALEQAEKMDVGMLFDQPDLQEMFEKMLKTAKSNEYGAGENKKGEFVEN